MKQPYVIDWRRLEEGVHHLEWVVGDGFWEDYPESGISGGKVNVAVEAAVGKGDVRLDVAVEGSVTTTCDRCLDECELPTKYRDEVVVKREEGEADLAQHIYESIVLGLPLLRVHEDKVQCNPEMLKRICKS